jgi:hypothetical protein
MSTLLRACRPRHPEVAVAQVLESILLIRFGRNLRAKHFLVKFKFGKNGLYWLQYTLCTIQDCL